ncbi:hypothetical protein F53441_13385 [Fusarium austroafricanum]|uniref:Heterokaryon incompatibility domain-containing protein n=1 Tax=Fusarium austroafricanum TaxID=2364996 RepID=A0A8H4JRU3_9HYPO|nr:hypothetical protein F53441_13385 [Fusarium austroafricanum]
MSLVLPIEWPCSKFYTFEHHETFKALDQSAASGCPLCRIVRQVLIFGAETNKLMATSCPITAQISGPSQISFALVEGDAAAFSSVGSYGLLEVKESAGNSLNYGSKIRRFRPADQARELEDVVTSCIQPWVLNCCKDSGNVQSAPLPTRVVDVGSGNDDPRLVETSGQHGTYLILSYCWGKGNDRAKTTQHNLQKRKRAIKDQDLPPTIKQAIEVTKKLGFRYIWIDAICIVQAHSVPPKYDELEDWRREAPNMGRYYRNAVLTIAATAAIDSEHGFVQERLAQIYPVSPCPVGIWAGDSGPHSTAVVVPGEPSASNQVHYAPLYSRGWTLQERALSHHTLHWCWESVFWECSGCIKASEFQPDIQRSSNDRVHVWETALTKSRDNAAYYNHLWPDLIEDYCQMNLSYETDRLMAIQGLVDQAQPSSRAGGGYIAGVYKPGIITGIAWCNPTPRIEKETKFPSWSWASLAPGDLYFHHIDGEFTRMKSVNDFDITGRDVHSDGRLKLTGPLREMHTSLITSDNNSRFAIIDKVYPFKMDFNFDTVGRVLKYIGDITLLALGWKVEWREEQNRRVIGLVLWPTGGKAGEYRRIGIFEVLETTNSTVWDDAPNRDVEIV